LRRPVGENRHTNESLGLVGGGIAARWGVRRERTHQRVPKDSLVVIEPPVGGKKKTNAPTSPKDSLVVVEPPGGGKKRTNTPTSP
jgi:hypothetical protein